MKNEILNTSHKVLSNIIRLKNSGKTSLLVYTDSRGYDVAGKSGKNPFKGYLGSLISRYKVTYRICPEKYTTILDFLDFYEQQTAKYDFVIMHCGVVDFSPRPVSNIDNVKASKLGNPYFQHVFSKNADHHQTFLGPKYKDEALTTIYSHQYFENHIGPRLKAIKNLIWINSNDFVKGWEGNYTKGRPVNIAAVVKSYEALMYKFVGNYIDLGKWNASEIKLNTIDNIHFTSTGFNKVAKAIIHFIEHEKVSGRDRPEKSVLAPIRETASTIR